MRYRDRGADGGLIWMRWTLAPRMMIRSMCGYNLNESRHADGCFLLRPVSMRPFRIVLLLLTLFLDCDPALAYLVKDINAEPPSTPGSLPERFTPVGDRLFFYADDGIHGKELWITDGLPGGATPVADIRPGSKGADLTRHAIEYNGLLYFSANDGTSGEELWSSDGSPEGTQRVRDIVPGEGGSAPTELFKFQNEFYFSSYTPETGTALWRSDGSAEGTEMILPVAGCCALGRFVPSGNQFFFAAGGGLWRS
ncbi:MAG: hypothetical protein KC931_21900, partial [Candidatus Omnitrophica bacterium]|nr:hypothetical protein [Candidatus Omnitrophota bacterium]